MAADELSPYRINVDAAKARRIEEGALNEEKKLEAGAYGYVYKVVVGGVKRTAKKLHKHFTNRSEVSFFCAFSAGPPGTSYQSSLPNYNPPTKMDHSRGDAKQLCSDAKH